MLKTSTWIFPLYRKCRQSYPKIWVNLGYIRKNDYEKCKERFRTSAAVVRVTIEIEAQQE
jgi:hypothetical protein